MCSLLLQYQLLANRGRGKTHVSGLVFLIKTSSLVIVVEEKQPLQAEISNITLYFALKYTKKPLKQS